jgi:hypothetical protein
MKQFLGNLIKQMNEKGVPIPLIRKDGVGSVSLTLLWLSSIVVIAALFKFGKIEFWESLAWHVTSAILYYNRSAKISKDGVEISSSKEDKGQAPND